MTLVADPGAPPRTRSHGTDLAVAGLVASAAATVLAPAVLPDGYSWISRTTSEAAAQGLSGAWLGRLGFLLFGLSVLLLADVGRRSWGRWGTALHVVFGVSMTAAAAFSNRPWLPAHPADRTEDLLHSVAASAMGVAFAAGVVAVMLGERRLRQWRGALDVVAVVASVVLPFAMVALPSIDGVLQRLMFAIAYVWYASEALRIRRSRDVASPSPAR
jgi:hypothetical protein